MINNKKTNYEKDKQKIMKELEALTSTSIQNEKYIKNINYKIENLTRKLLFY